MAERLRILMIDPLLRRPRLPRADPRKRRGEALRARVVDLFGWPALGRFLLKGKSDKNGPNSQIFC